VFFLDVASKLRITHSHVVVVCSAGENGCFFFVFVNLLGVIDQFLLVREIGLINIFACFLDEEPLEGGVLGSILVIHAIRREVVESTRVDLLLLDRLLLGNRPGDQFRLPTLHVIGHDFDDFFIEISEQFGSAGV